MQAASYECYPSALVLAPAGLRTGEVGLYHNRNLTQVQCNMNTVQRWYNLWLTEPVVFWDHIWSSVDATKNIELLNIEAPLINTRLFLFALRFVVQLK